MDFDTQEQINTLPGSITDAYERIKPHVLKTPLTRSMHLSTDGDVYLKLESEQLTGSAKFRGALNKLFVLKEREPASFCRGFTAASSGNHALALLEASRLCGGSVDVFVRKGISPGKKEALLERGTRLTLYGEDVIDSEKRARQVAEEQQKIYISPYNDLDVIAGIGTAGLEIYDQLPSVDAVFVSVGAGGIISGTAAYLKSRNPNIKVIGCQPRNSKVMYESVRAGRIKHGPSLDSLSDGTVGDIEDGTITFPLCRDLVDNWILVNEKDIEEALYLMVDKEHKLVEGSAAMVVAAYRNNAEQFRGQKVVLLMCGSNISTEDLTRVLYSNSRQ